MITPEQLHEVRDILIQSQSAVEVAIIAHEMNLRYLQLKEFSKEQRIKYAEVINLELQKLLELNQRLHDMIKVIYQNLTGRSSKSQLAEMMTNYHPWRDSEGKTILPKLF